MTSKIIHIVAAFVVAGLVGCSQDSSPSQAQSSQSQAQIDTSPPAQTVESSQAVAPEQQTAENNVPNVSEQTATSNPVDDDNKTEDTKADQLKDISAQIAALPADAGQKRYEATCKICHEKGLLDAPKFGSKADWQARLKKDKDLLYRHSAHGFNKMPAQAVGDISEAEVYAAVDYILAQVS